MKKKTDPSERMGRSFPYWDGNSAAWVRASSFFCTMAKKMKHMTIWEKVEMGTLSPMANSVPNRILMKYATGMRTTKAETMPCSMTKPVLPRPLKYPTKQKRKLVSRQSMP